MKKKLNINKTVITIIVLNTIQIGVIAAIIIYNFMNKSGLAEFERYSPREILLILVILTVFISSFLIIKDVKAMTVDNCEYHMVKDSLHQVEELNNTLRAQRHDFMNHLQVVYSLMEMKDYTEAQDYIEKIYNDIQRVNEVLRTSNPAINALLQAKRLYGEKRGIEVELYITSQFKDLRIPSWEFCRVLGNIIDNGIYALSEGNGYKTMEIELYEDLKVYGFRIKNNGPRIAETIKDKIFQSGFTTKKDKGEGMGLAISQEILRQYGGDIKVDSQELNTIFHGWVPIK
jgi:two-component system, LytTR family, sensor histidine kinase AgrC